MFIYSIIYLLIVDCIYPAFTGALRWSKKQGHNIKTYNIIYLVVNHVSIKKYNFSHKKRYFFSRAASPAPPRGDSTQEGRGFHAHEVGFRRRDVDSTVCSTWGSKAKQETSQQAEVTTSPARKAREQSGRARIKQSKTGNVTTSRSHNKPWHRLGRRVIVKF